MNATGNSLHHQKGAILPVVLLLGMGLMIGVAGVVNLGFVQDDLARAERAAMDSAIATQYLSDYQQVLISQASGSGIASGANAGQPQGALIPFPVSGTPLFASATNAASSCFATGDSFYNRGQGEFGAGKTTPFTLGDVRPVDFEIDPDSLDIGFDLQGKSPSYLIEYMGRRFHAITLGSGTQRIELSRLGETDIDSLYAHFWVKLQLPAGIGAASTASVPLFANVASGATGPAIFLKLTAASSGAGADYRLDPVIAGASHPTNSTGTMDRVEWLSVHFWFSAPSDRVWYRIKQRGFNVGGGIERTIPVNFNLERNSAFYVGHIPGITAGGPIITNAEQPFDMATVRVWLEPPISNASGAAAFADSLMQMDTRRPGGEFNVTTGPGALSIAIGEPESYVTLDSPDALVPLNSGQLIASEWQPLFGQPIVFGSATGPYVAGGNPSSNNELERGGPPASEQLYVFHSCDEQTYQFVQRTRRYTRGAGGVDQQVEWQEE